MVLEGKEQGRTAPGVPEICKGPAGNTWEVFGELRMGGAVNASLGKADVTRFTAEGMC